MYRFKWITIIVGMAMFFVGTNSFAQKRSNNDSLTVFRGNKIVLHKIDVYDSILLEDPVAGNVKTILVPIYAPVSVNAIQVRKELPPYRTSKEIQKKIIPELESYFTSLAFPDGTIRLRLRNIVVSKKGDIVYYELESVQLSQATDNMNRSIAGETFALRAIKAAVGLLLRQLDAFYTLLNLDLFNSTFIVKNGKATFVQ